MNKQQRMILIASAVLVAIMLIYPPFQLMGRGMGYSWLFSPPHHAAMINAGQLLVQWVAVALIAGILFVLSKDSNLSVDSSDFGDVETPSKTNLSEGVFKTVLFILRFIRGFVGFVGFWQVVGLLPIFSWIANYDPATPYAGIGEMLALVTIKLVVASICFGVFFLLRSFINKLYVNQYGTPHPNLVKKWSL